MFGWIVSAAVAAGTGPRDGGLSSSSSLYYSSRLSEDSRLMERKGRQGSGGKAQRHRGTRDMRGGEKNGALHLEVFLMSPYLHTQREKRLH